MSKRVPRLKDVAEAANVSISAASRILRGEESRFGEETCQRVLEASRRLGWRPNLLVNGIQTGRTRTVGVMIPPYDSFWIAVLSGIHARFAEADFLPITVWIGDLEHMPQFEADEKRGLELINRLLDRRVDAFVLWPPIGMAYREHLPEFRDRAVPIVTIDHHPDQPLWDTVATNEQSATAMVAKHLLDLGHRRIAVISTRETPAQTWALERRKSFEAAIERGCPEAELRVWRLNAEGNNGAEVATQLLRSRLRPTAVFAATDHEAAYVYQAASKLGVRIPEDLSVVGFADLDFAATMSPPLTTVRQRAREIGDQAASLVLRRLSSDGDAGAGPFSNVRVDGDLILRDSTGPAAADAVE
ncbi:Catabolite control protein A [Botrimarina colliarenosi]|uniref:Catabolite control protein A n=1 Tax=Botrimarina colliarenosi TaxID=2528001 RepID=A0A5C5ZZ57_9BACT|nr:LacI family DNA-binding transcriptional regulator [Botrimarina colliarenosi]TWT92844.1 Catabolite control protein A [Botrimarina colliarenosi]